MTAPNTGGAITPAGGGSPGGLAGGMSTTAPATVPTTPGLVGDAPDIGTTPADPAATPGTNTGTDARAYYDQVARDAASVQRPTKLGAESEDGFDAEWTPRAVVYLDEREQRRVLSADTVAGVVRRIRDPRPGQKARRDDVETLTGRVRIHYRAPGMGTSFALGELAK